MLISMMLAVAVNPPTYAATSCKNYQIVFARGSGEILSDTNYRTFKASLTATFNSGLNQTFAFYELGTNKQGGYRYGAVDTSGLSVIAGAKISAGTAFSYGESITQGVGELKAYFNNVTKTCPATKFILAGYSQGAQVISSAISSLDANKIAYVATFGDPKLYLPEGKRYGISPPAACYGKSLSNYRINVPDCTVYQGVLGATIPYQPGAYQDKLGTWCNLHDPMCGSSVDFGNIMGAHIAYATDDSYAHASRVVLAALRKQNKSGTSTTSGTVTTANRNTAILIDSTGSMSDHIENYKKHALNLATSIINGGGRVALYEYRDLADPYLPRQLCGFSCTLSEFVAKLNGITTDGGGDTPESAISAGLTLLNDLSWDKGATKTLTILTDAPTHDPDLDGTTAAQLIQRAWEIDPVHISVITDTADAEIVASYQEIVEQTGGKLYNLTAEEMELSTTDTLATDEEITIPYLYGEMEIPTIALASADKSANSLRLTLQKSENTAATLVTVAEAPLAITAGDVIELTDLTEVTTITLTPISTTGYYGEPIVLQFSPQRATPKAPNTGR